MPTSTRKAGRRSAASWPDNTSCAPTAAMVSPPRLVAASRATDCRERFGEQRQPRTTGAVGDGHEGGGAAPGGLEGKQLGEALDRFGDVRAELPERVARLRPEPVDPRPAAERREQRVAEERQQDEGERPGDRREHASTEAGTAADLLGELEEVPAWRRDASASPLARAARARTRGWSRAS